MIQSPARTQVGKLLADGNVAVFLMVPGKDRAGTLGFRCVVDSSSK